MKDVIIGIQARSTSSRLPNKANKILGDMSILSRVAYQANRVCGWFGKDKTARVKLLILVPYGDPIKEELSHKFTVIEGPENDVLSRYSIAMDVFNPDYLVRLTGDCAWIPSKMISKAIRDALKYKADYCTNTLIRTFPEGYDTEVISRDMFSWLDANARDEYHREHVTSLIPHSIYTWDKDLYHVHNIINDYDLSEIKTSIDTEEEYQKAIYDFDSLESKKQLALTLGSVSV
jgi:spore coat polysaccharide biosynthesis protein SpsF (cytidylyltransferase family)